MRLQLQNLELILALHIHTDLDILIQSAVQSVIRVGKSAIMSVIEGSSGLQLPTSSKFWNCFWLQTQLQIPTKISLNQICNRFAMHGKLRLFGPGVFVVLFATN